MKTLLYGFLGLFATLATSSAQTTFTVTGSPIPASVLKQNYGRMPKGISAYDLSICNSTAEKQSVVSSEIYQAIVKQYPAIQPIGRQIMLASILRNQSLSATNLAGVTLNAATGLLTVLSTTKVGVPSGLGTAAALGSLVLPQLLSNLKPVLAADQLEKFDSQVLELALVLDGGSCVERTIFTLGAAPKAKKDPLSFHIR